jgi:hypothetical protein
MKVAGGTHRGTAIPRWDWSGVDKLRVPEICGESLKNIYQMLPVKRSSPQQLASEISALGARYHRYLYQDEFGSTRAECMAALRETHSRVRLLDSLIGDLPQHLALKLSYGAAEADQSLSFRPVTNSAFRNARYTSAPESLAGKFVVAVVEALQPSKSWVADRLPPDAAIRARKFAASPAARARMVHFAMRDYVAHHRRPGTRRGRPRVAQ